MELNVTTRKSFNEILDKQIKGTQRKDDTQNGTYGIALDLISKSKNSTTETNCCGPECVIFTDLC